MTTTNQNKNKIIGTKGFKRREQEVGAHSISYLVYNEKKKVRNTFVLSHGAACTSFTMQPLANELKKKYPTDRIIVIDVPWHGQSTSTESITGKNVIDYSVIVNEFLSTLIKEEKIVGKLTWLGWSMGGSLGLLADKGGIPIDNLVLLCSSPYWATLSAMTEATPALLDANSSVDVWEAVILSEVANLDKKHVDVFKENIQIFLSKPEVAVNDLKVLGPEFYDLRESLSQINAETFIFGGSQDFLANVELQNLLYTGIPKSHLEIFDDSHGLILKPKRIESIIKSLKSSIK